MVTMNLGPIGIRVVVVSAPSTSRPAPMSRCRGTVCLGQISVSQALTVSLVEGDAALRTQRHFAAICEAVLWLIVIDSDQEKVDGYCHAREESSAGTMRGLRYVRNGVAHHIRVSQWTERQGDFDPRVFSQEFSTPGFRWRDRRDVDRRREKPLTRRLNEEKLIAAYDENLAGREVVDAIRSAQAWLELWFSGPRAKPDQM